MRRNFNQLTKIKDIAGQLALAVNRDNLRVVGLNLGKGVCDDKGVEHWPVDSSLDVAITPGLLSSRNAFGDLQDLLLCRPLIAIDNNVADGGHLCSLDLEVANRKAVSGVNVHELRLFAELASAE